jgi:AbrB family looped-hinge helix DNA binding protein
MMSAPSASFSVQQKDGWSLASRASACRTLLKMEAVIRAKIGRKLSSTPYLGSLLQIYLAEIEGERIYQACHSTDYASSTAHRRSSKLEELGALVREGDPVDGRCTDLKLDRLTKEALEQAIDVMISHCLELGNEISRDGYLIPDRQMRYHFAVGTDEDVNGMTILRGKVIAGGRIALPADVRRSLGLQNGDTVLFEVNGDEVRIRPARSALRRVQERLRAFAPTEGLVSDELIAERRAEAARD